MKIWANSGDSHLVEPDDLFTTSLPRSTGRAHAPVGEGRRRQPRDDLRRRSGVPAAHAQGRHRAQGRERAHRRRAGPGRQRHEAAPGRPRSGGHLGRARVPLDRDLDVVDHRPEAARRRVRGRQRLGVRAPAVQRPLRLHGDDPAARRRARRRRDPPRRRHRVRRRVLLGDARPRRRRLAVRHVGARLGGDRRDRAGDRLSHRHRGPRRLDDARRSTSAGPAVRSSTTSRPPTAASGPSPS